MGSVVGPRITDRNIPGNRQPTERALGCLIEVGRAGSNQSGQAADDSRDRLQVRDEQRHLTLASRVVGRPQDRGRVTVAITCGASGDGISFPRCCVTLKEEATSA